MRKFLIILGALTVLGGIAGAVYYFFFRPTVKVSFIPSPSLPGAGQASSTPPESTSTTTSSVPDTTTSPQTTTPIASSARLSQINAGPVVPGIAVISTPSSPTAPADTMVNFILRQSGNVYSYSLARGETTRTNNKTLPGIQSARWTPDGSLAYVQYLTGADASTINTYALPKEGGGGYFLNQNLSDLAVGSSSVLTLTSNTTGSVLALSKPGASPTTVVTTPLSALRVAFAGKQRYLVFTKPSGTLLGSAYVVDTTGFSRVAGPLLGLTALPSPSGKVIAVSYISEGSLTLSLATASSTALIPLPVTTLTDKCVWASDDTSLYCGVPTSLPLATYPDDWYRGVIHLSDRIWRIHVADRYAELVLDFAKETSSPLDAESLAVDPRGTVLSFINKNDGSLWRFKL